jgi:6,7-dimethyl-8-ribityllumazine synthase
VREIEGHLDGSGKRFAIVVSRFHSDITAELESGAVEALLTHGLEPSDLEVIHVPGAWELPVACARVIERGGVDAVVALGCVIRGETPHFEYVAGEAARGLATLQREAKVPIAFGVLTTENVDQARGRAGPGPDNKGWEAALSALEMANLFGGLR